MIRRIGRWVGSTVLTLIILAAVVVFVFSWQGIARFVPVLSNSMAPGMPQGSIALVTPEPRTAVKAGDVIVFTAPDGSGHRIIHRVTFVYTAADAKKFDNWDPNKLFFTTKGDNNPSKDPWVVSLGDATVWKQRAVVPYGGWLFIWLAEPSVRIIAFASAGAALTAWALMGIWRRPAMPADDVDASELPEPGEPAEPTGAVDRELETSG